MLLPASKSLTNRDLILAALTKWKTILRGILKSDDTDHMIQALTDLWYTITREWNDVTIDGGIFHIKWKDKEIYLWNSGTSMRFLTWLSVLNTIWSITLTGNEYMKRRPLKDLVDALEQLWSNVVCETWCPPITITPTKKRLKNEISLKWTSSSQYLTALLMIAPCLSEWLTISIEWELVSKPYIDLTIHEMNKFWISVENQSYQKFIIPPQVYKPQDLTLEGDASWLSYPVAYTLLHGWTMTIDNMWSATKQWDYWFLKYCEIFWLKHKSDFKTTTFLSSWIDKINLSDHHWISIDFESMPDVSLTYMILAPFLPWNTTLTWLQTLNLKECKRIDAMAEWLKSLWISVEYTHDTMIIWELTKETISKLKKWTKIQINSYDDHRIAMSFGVLDTYLWWVMNISSPECVAKTYPTFWEELKSRWK